MDSEANMPPSKRQNISRADDVVDEYVNVVMKYPGNFNLTLMADVIRNCEHLHPIQYYLDDATRWNRDILVSLTNSLPNSSDFEAEDAFIPGIIYKAILSHLGQSGKYLVITSPK